MEQSKEENIHIYIRIGDTFISYSVCPKQHTFSFISAMFLFYKRRTKTWALHYTFNCSLMQTSVSTHWSHCSLVDKIICYLAHKARAASSAMQYKKLLNSISVLTRSVEIMVSARCFLLLSSERLCCFWEAEQLTYMANDEEEEGREKHFIMRQKSGKFSRHTHYCEPHLHYEEEVHIKESCLCSYHVPAR